VGDVVRSVVPPTATQSLASVHEIPPSPLSTPATLGLGTTDHLLPSQVSTRVCPRPDAESTMPPTAMQSLEARHVTSVRSPV
jgi:hypothetical protein